MLMGSDINPFDSQETKPYKNDARIAAMTDLVDAYQRDDIHGYEKILQSNKDLLEDRFIAENIDEVTRNMRTKAVLKLVAPYTRFTLTFISKQLKISLAEVQDILGFLIVDKRLRGKINQRDGTVEVEGDVDLARVQAVKEWSTAIGTLWGTVLNETDRFANEEGPLGLPGGLAGTFGGPPGGQMRRPFDGGSGFGKPRSGAGGKSKAPAGKHGGIAAR